MITCEWGANFGNISDVLIIWVWLRGQVCQVWRYGRAFSGRKEQLSGVLRMAMVMTASYSYIMLIKDWLLINTAILMQCSNYMSFVCQPQCGGHSRPEGWGVLSNNQPALLFAAGLASATLTFNMASQNVFTELLKLVPGGYVGQQTHWEASTFYSEV